MYVLVTFAAHPPPKPSCVIGWAITPISRSIRQEYNPIISEAPDPRTQAVAAAKGIVMNDLRARQMRFDDFHDFDLLFAMDKSHYHWMQVMAPKGTEDKVKLYLEYAGISKPNEVPDPYYGQTDGFEEVLNLIERATDSLLKKWKL